MSDAGALEAAKRFVALGDDPGVFMTCESSNKATLSLKPCVRLECQDLEHAHAVHRAIIDIANGVRAIDSEAEPD